MHKMQTIVTCDCGVNLSVSRLSSAERIKILFGMNTLVGSMNIVLVRGLGSWGKFCQLRTRTYIKIGRSYRLEILCAYRGLGTLIKTIQKERVDHNK